MGMSVQLDMSQLTEYHVHTLGVVTGGGQSASSFCPVKCRFSIVFVLCCLRLVKVL